jgi:ABC-type lipoprotein export system ATPase subunit
MRQPEPGAIVSLEHVSKLFATGGERRWVLRGVSLSIRRRDMVVIEGPSGSGKSTLLNVVSGLTRPTRGRVLVEGRDLGALDLDQLAILRRRRIGFIFQSPNLFPHLTALENVVLPAGEGGRRRAARLLSLVGLGARWASYPHQLSGGEQQRVAIARALVNAPGIVLADEPTGSLDARRKLEIMNLFRRLNALGTTLLVVTHDAQVASMGLKRVVIEDGRLREAVRDEG